VSISLTEAGAADSSTVAPRALLGGGSAGHAGLLRSDGLTFNGSRRLHLVLALEYRSRKSLGLRALEASTTNSSTVAPSASLTISRTGQTILLRSQSIASRA